MKLQDPTNLKTNVFFIVLFSLCTGILFYMIRTSHITLPAHLPPMGWAKTGFAVAGLTGLFLPLLAFLILWGNWTYQKIFLSLVVVLLAQIVTERILYNSMMTPLIIIAALLYVSYRLWQLAFSLIKINSVTLFKSWHRTFSIITIYLNLVVWSIIWGNLAWTEVSQLLLSGS